MVVVYSFDMNVLITGGGTREDIDPVRGITNYSTGRLASCVAERFLAAGADVTYICGENAVRPDGLDACVVRSTMQMLSAMELALFSARYDFVVHAAAVSDFTPENPSLKKISSDVPQINLVLKRLPKLINRVKEIQPETLLVGFKLLSGVGEEELLLAARKLMAGSGADYVLANRLEDIYGNSHKALLLGADGVLARASNKLEIAEMIFREVTG